MAAAVLGASTFGGVSVMAQKVQKQWRFRQTRPEW